MITHTNDLRQLRHLIALGSYPTLAEASENLGVTKSALSQSIQRLEDIYGVPLFIRSRRGIRATVYGEKLVEAARQSVELFAQTARQLEHIQNLETGRTVIGCDPVVSELLLSRALVRIHQNYPQLKYVLKTGFWSDMRLELESRSIDLFVGIRPDADIPEFEVAKFLLPGIFLFCRHGHPLTDLKKVVLNDVYKYPVVGPVMPEWFYAQLEEHRVEAAGPDSPRGKAFFLLTNDSGTVREIVSQSDAVSGSFVASIQSDVTQGRLSVLPINSPPFGKPIECVTVLNQQHAVSPAALAILQALREVASQLGRDAKMTKRRM